MKIIEIKPADTISLVGRADSREKKYSMNIVLGISTVMHFFFQNISIRFNRIHQTLSGCQHIHALCLV